MNIWNALAGFAIIVSSAVIGMVMDMQYDVKPRAAYWALGALSGVIANAVMLWPLLA